MIPVRVASRSVAAHDVVRLELETLDGSPLPPFTAGSHIDVILANGLTRQYSLSSPPGHGDRYRIAVLREPESRGGSQFVHDALLEGMTLSISPPRNLFHLHEESRTYVLLAGGIGITPLLAMAYRLSALGKDFVLHYCARAPSRAAFLDELKARPFAHVRLHFDDAPETQLDLDQALCDPSPDRRLYVCGPNGFMDFVVQGARARGWSPEHIHQEHFAGAAIPEGHDRAFALVIASTGQTITVGPDQTAAHALEAAGVFVPLSCEQGVCGTCLTGILAGQPDHRDLFQTEAEKASNLMFTPCCSRARTPVLTLDL